MHILAVSGSLRNESTNTRLLAAAVQLAPQDVDIRLTSSLAGLPPFSPDIDPLDVDVVARWAEEIRVADGLIVSTPEYAGGYPGVLKNAFDWLVGTDAFVQKPFMLLNASPRSVNAQRTFVKVLETMSGVHIERASATIDLLGMRLGADEIVANPEHAARIRASVRSFVESLRQAQVAVPLSPDDAGTNRPK